MILLHKPAASAIRKFLARQTKLDLSYPHVGATTAAGRGRPAPPALYVVDHTRVRLGEGAQVFAAARAALQRWEQFRLGWVEAWPADTPIREGEVVAVLAHSLGLWWINACRIVSVLDHEGPIRAFGFAYGTLPAHAGMGEERFLVEWDQEEGGVWYDLLAFSRPQHLLARLGYPWFRKLQKRFGRDSAAAMRRATAHASV
jgi:uncharacterized protein (UPF0548 family)